MPGEHIVHRHQGAVLHRQALGGGDDADQGDRHRDKDQRAQQHGAAEVFRLRHEEEEAGAKTEVVQKAEQNVNVTGPEIIINIPEQKSETKTIVKEVPAKPAPPKKTKEEKETEARKDAGFDW